MLTEEKDYLMVPSVFRYHFRPIWTANLRWISDLSADYADLCRFGGGRGEARKTSR